MYIIYWEGWCFHVVIFVFQLCSKNKILDFSSISTNSRDLTTFIFICYKIMMRTWQNHCYFELFFKNFQDFKHTFLTLQKYIWWKRHVRLKQKMSSAGNLSEAISKMLWTSIYESKALCIVFIISFRSYANKTNFHMKASHLAHKQPKLKLWAMIILRNGGHCANTRVCMEILILWSGLGGEILLLRELSSISTS